METRSDVKIAFRSASPSDWHNVSNLLQSAKLPLDGVEEHITDFLVAVRGDHLVGCAALERYDSTGLLRSLAVTEAERGTGLGKELVQRILNAARGDGIKQMVLLTETARGFFPRFGFREITRAEVPPPALASVEFRTVCPQSATVMMVDL